MDPEETLRRLRSLTDDATYSATVPRTDSTMYAEQGLARAVGAAPPAPRRVVLPEMRIEAPAPTAAPRTDPLAEDPDADATLGDEGFGPQPTQTPRGTLDDILASTPDVPGLFAEGAFPGIIPTVGGLHGLFTGEGSAGERWSAGRQHGQDLLTAARERSPTTAGVAGTAGAISDLLPSGGTSAGGFAARAAPAVGMGATFGLLGSQAGDEDPTAADAAGETALGAAVPLAIESVIHGGGRVARAVARSAPYQRIASLLGERFGNGSSREVDRFVRDVGHGDAERAASMIEDLGLVGPASHVDDVVERSRAALSEAEAATGARRAAFHDAGHRVPTETLPAALEGEADRMSTSPRRARYAPRVRDEAQRAREVLRSLQEANGTSLAHAEDALEPVRELAGFRSLAEPQSAQRGWRDALRSGRRAIDDVVEATLPETERGMFAAERGRVQASRLATDLSTRRARMAALRSPLSQMMLPAMLATALGGGAGALGAESGAGAGGSTAIGAIGAGLAYRSLRGRDAALFASTSRLVQRLVENGTAGRLFGAAGRALEAAAGRGALPQVHEQLMESDPEYAQAMMQLAEDDASESDSIPFDESMINDDSIPFDESMLETTAP